MGLLSLGELGIQPQPYRPRRAWGGFLGLGQIDQKFGSTDPCWAGRARAGDSRSGTNQRSAMALDSKWATLHAQTNSSKIAALRNMASMLENLVATDKTGEADMLLADVEDAVGQLENAKAKVEREWRNALSADASFGSRGDRWCIHTPHELHRDFVAELEGYYQSAATAVAAAESRVQLSMLQSRLGKIQRAIQRQTDIEREQERLRQVELQEIERTKGEQAALVQAQTTAKTESERMRLEHERWLREQELQMQQAQLDWQRQQAQAVADREARLREAEVAREQFALEAQQAREQIALEQLQWQQEMERRRMEREEAEIEAAAQQKAVLEQLKLMKEMGVQVPGPGMVPGMPGMVPGMQYGFEPIYMPQAQPSPFFAPAGAVAPTGLPFVESPFAPAAAQAMAPAPAAWSPFQMEAFAPGQELFGLGADPAVVLPFMPVAHPFLKGASIAQGYQVFGPTQHESGNNVFTFQSPDGRAFPIWSSVVVGPQAQPVKDPDTGLIVYSPPPGGVPQEESFEWGKLFTEIVPSLVRTGTGAYRDITAAREEQKLLAEQRRQEALVREAGAFQPTSISRIPTWLYGVLGIGLAVGVTAKIFGGKKKNGKK